MAKILRWTLFTAVCSALFVLPVVDGLAQKGPKQPEKTASTIALRLPLEGEPHITRGFDAPANPYAAGHRGVDFGSTPGAAVHAAAAGVVSFAGQVAGRLLVVVEHSNGWRTTYEPVEPGVAVGDAIAKGQPVGTLLAGHPCPVVACLHWGLRDGDTYLNPLLYISIGPIRLLPMESS